MLLLRECDDATETDRAKVLHSAQHGTDQRPAWLHRPRSHIAMNIHTASFVDLYEPVLHALYQKFGAPVGAVRLQRTGHVCHADRCRLVSFVMPSMPPQWGDVFLCLHSNNVHFCGGVMCDLKEEVVLHEGIDNHYVCPLTRMYIAADMDRCEHLSRVRRPMGNTEVFDEDECVPPFPPWDPSPPEDTEPSHVSDADHTANDTQTVASDAKTSIAATATPGVRSRTAHDRIANDARDVHRRSAVFSNLLKMAVPAVRIADATLHQLVQQMERVWIFLNKARAHSQGSNKKAHLTPKTFALWFVHCLGSGWSVTLFDHPLQLVPCHADMTMGPVKRNAGYVVNDHTVGEKAVQFLLQRVSQADVLEFVAERTKATAVRVHDSRPKFYCLSHRPLKKPCLSPALP